MLIFFTNSSLIKLQVRNFSLFFGFLVLDDLEWFRMGSISSNINLMLVFFILAPTFPFLNIIDDLRDIICNVVIYANKTTLHSVIRDLIFSNN